MNSKVKTILIIIGSAVGLYLLGLFLLFGLTYFMVAGAKVEETTDISKYTEVIGPKAKKEYANKWMDDKKVFPKTVDNLNVEDFKMVYYNPWDAQYLSYLVVDYDEEAYAEEIKRLKKLGIDDYKGIYEVTGFTNYELVAMDSDAYNGFIYALTDGESKIIYVEIIFCNYVMDLDYTKYIDTKYLPDGFDATDNNNYRKKMMKEK